MNKPNYEDIVMKKAMQFFAEEGLKFLGIKQKIKSTAPTEIIILEAKNMYLDYTFLSEDETFIHLEFQSTDKSLKDLRRFRAYEAMLCHQTQKDVVTYVFYTGDIKNPKTTLKTGINRYKVNGITLSNLNGDQILAETKLKMQNCEPIDRQALIALAFTPVMGGKLSKTDKINQAVRLSKNIKDPENKMALQSILFAFASKFLADTELNMIKEELMMTQLGQMIYEDGLQEGKQEGKQEGRQEGRQEGKIEAAESLLDLLPDEIIADKLALPLKTVQDLRKQTKITLKRSL